MAAAVIFPPQYNTWVPPACGESFTDLAFGTLIKRISDARATIDTTNSVRKLTSIEPEYATMSPWNCDQSFFLLIHDSYFGLYSRAGVYLGPLPFEISASSEPRWSRSNPALFYYHVDNQLRSYDITSKTVRALRSFAEYDSVIREKRISGKGEGDLSFDGDHIALCGDDRFVFVYQISADTKLDELDTQGHPFDSLYITKNGVLISWGAKGLPVDLSKPSYCGIELFDYNMQFQYQVTNSNGHKDVCLDVDGSPVLVWTNSDEAGADLACPNGVQKINLVTRVRTCLLPLDWSLSVHISAPDCAGYVFVDTEAPSNPDETAWKPYTNELLKVALDGSGTRRLAHHRSRKAGGGYNWQPKVTCSRDGSRLLYASNMAAKGECGDYADTYMIALDGIAPALIPRTLEQRVSVLETLAGVTR